ncbi:VOC family protein [Streptomyces sp. XD-27]|uniref:VOC family protein n=1 Tax=Streptomyces sp. XD-27 TaxID=3062779 RepID=UPI0026F47782|nr:VOC family protein [Streptomyces sp. XD-27]WKX72283.1 VOC family protein [Streptomyces sp. XD-27]
MADNSTNGLLGKIAGPAIWAPDGRKLAEFYAAALGAEVGDAYADETGAEVAFPVPVGDATYFFSTAKSFKAPDWPAAELPFHLDLTFADAAAAEQRLLELGATKPEFQPGGDHWTILLDPSGQPFCISQSS